MKKSQAKGYLLEIVLAKLLKVNGYDLVTSTDNEIENLPRNGLNVKGRGGYHQFDYFRNVPYHATICIILYVYF